MPAKRLFIIWSCVLLAFSISFAMAQTSPELREEGVLYFEGNLPDKITATLHSPVTVYLHRDFQMVLAVLDADQKIELIGMSPEGYIIRAKRQNNTINGWIRPEELPAGIDTSLFAKAKQNQAHHDDVAVAIANKSVTMGMTPDEVKQSMGNPEQVESRTDAKGTSLTWTYVTYQDQSQYGYSTDPYGRPILQPNPVKVPVGQTTVIFTNGVVSSVTEHKTDAKNGIIQSN